MADHAIPKGVSLETLRDILTGWAAVGAAEEPKYTADVEEHTGVSDAVGRQNNFFEELGILEPEGQKHRLTETGAEATGPLVVADEEAATDALRSILESWPVTEELRGILRDNPTPEEDLVPVVAAITGQDPDSGRVETGARTLLELLDWVDLLERDEEGQYHVPEKEAAEAGAGEETETAGAEPESVTEANLEPAVEEVEPPKEETEAEVEPEAEPADGVELATGSGTGAETATDDEPEAEEPEPNAEEPSLGVDVDVEAGGNADSSESTDTGAENADTDIEAGADLDIHAAPGVEVTVSPDPESGTIEVVAEPESTEDAEAGADSTEEAEIVEAVDTLADGETLDALAETEGGTEAAIQALAEAIAGEDAEAEETKAAETSPEDQEGTEDDETAEAEADEGDKKSALSPEAEEAIEARLPSDESHTLTLNLDADPDDLETLVRGIKQGVTEVEESE
jgi:hypothetical protein